MKKKLIISGCGLLVVLGIVVAFLFNIGGAKEGVVFPKAAIGGYYPYTYSGVVKEIIDDDTVIVEQTTMGDSIGGIIEVTYDDLDLFDTFTASSSNNVTLSVGDEV